MKTNLIIAIIISISLLAACAQQAAMPAAQTPPAAAPEAQPAQEPAQQPAPAETPITPSPAPTPAEQPAAPAAEQAPSPAGDLKTGNVITIQNLAFSPNTIEVAAGETVTWENKDSMPHTASADDKSWDTGKINPGDSGTFTFSRPGAFTYHCNFHPDMKGAVVVQRVTDASNRPGMPPIPGAPVPYGSR